MLLNNYWKWFNYAQADVAETNITDVSLQQLAGTVFNAIVVTRSGYNYDNNQVRANHSFRKNVSVMLGTGDTAPSSSDYALEEAVNGVTNISAVNSYTNNSQNCTFTLTFTAEEDVVLKEIGIVKTAYAADSSTAQILLSRSLITPISVNAGETISLSYNWRTFEGE